MRTLPRTSPPRRVTPLRRGAMLFVMMLPALTTRCGPPETPPRPAALGIGGLLSGADTLHARATAPRAFTFPGDHGPHPEFRTEWWYFTGNLTGDDGRQLGYQLTFFRSALLDSASFLRNAWPDSASFLRSALPDSPSFLRNARPDSTAPAGGTFTDFPADTPGGVPGRSAWRARHAYMAHFAVADGATGEFRAAEKFGRGAAGLAGARTEPLRVWLDDWSAVSAGESTFPLRLRARSEDIAIDLVVERGKPIVLQGERGLSRKGPEPGNASYYYSLTRMPTRGTVRTSAGTWTARGASWLDREWSTSALSPGVVGWDWMSLQLNDTTELMVYRLRRTDGSVDRFSAATYVDRAGNARGFTVDDFVMTPTAQWRSGDGVRYPVGWRVEIPGLELMLDVTAAMDDQELELAVRYWEGMVDAVGTLGDRPITARGYLEMTGYADAPGRTR